MANGRSMMMMAMLLAALAMALFSEKNAVDAITYGWNMTNTTVGNWTGYNGTGGNNTAKSNQTTGLPANQTIPYPSSTPRKTRTSGASPQGSGMTMAGAMVAVTTVTMIYMME